MHHTAEIPYLVNKYSLIGNFVGGENNKVLKINTIFFGMISALLIIYVLTMFMLIKMGNGYFKWFKMPAKRKWEET